MATYDLIVIVVFAVVFAVLYIADVFKYYAFRAALRPVLDALHADADRVLAAYGARLRPAHDIVVAAATLLDQDGDTLVQVLPRQAITLLRDLLATAEALTDGEVDPPAAAGAAPLSRHD